jgi:hypothetical protein
MSHRRAVGGGPKVTHGGEEVPLTTKRKSASGASTVTSLSLEAGLPEDSESEGSTSVSVEERCENERHNQKVRHWKESPFACGLVEITWADERLKNNPPPSAAADEFSVDSANCLCFSAAVCPHLNAGRVGNMSVLRQSTVTVDFEYTDEETGELRIERVARPRLDLVVGESL